MTAYFICSKVHVEVCLLLKVVQINFCNTCIQAYEKGFKPKGTIFPCGYEVNANVDETMAERLKNLAKMMGKVIL